ncbi:MAG: TonB-dependent receptor [Deltaproteobacteria bacterium]|nr:TonB-dependent receptor [Deltaproteobacteria bacterium]MBN2671327.1 TonB-dependent receptor [Deltaproteobacteria bacterium]
MSQLHQIRSRIAGFIFLLGIFSFTSVAMSQEVSEPSSLSMTPNDADNPNPSTITVSNDRIRENPAVDNTDHFTHLPGVYIQRPLPNAGSLSLRGLGGNRNLITVDGVRFSNGLYGNYPNDNLSNISPYIVHEATVYKGPGAFPYANGGIGSVIAVSTLAPNELRTGVHGDGKFLYSSGIHTPGISLDSAIVRNAHAILVGADHISFGELRGGDGLKIPYTESTRTNWRAKLVLEPHNSPLTVTGAYIGHVGLGNNRTDHLGYGTIHTYENSDNLVIVDLNWDPHPVVEKLKIVASYHQTIENGDRYNCVVLGGRSVIHLPSCHSLVSANNGQKTRDIVDTFGIDASSKLALAEDRVALFGNVEYYFDNVISSSEEARIVPGLDNSTFLSQNRGLYSSGSYFSKFGISLGLEGRLLKTRAGDLLALMSGRFSNFAAYAPVVPGLEEDIHYSHNAFTDAAGIRWQKDDIFSLFGNYATGFRTPSLQESTALGYVAGEYQIPNVDLQPERSNQFELGTTLKIKVIRVGAVWFHNRIDQFIDERPAAWQGLYVLNDGTNVVQRQNARRAVFEGVESTLAITIKTVTLSANLTWQRGEISDDTDGYLAGITGNANHYPARRVPRFFGSSKLTFRHPSQRFYAAIGIDWADNQTELHPLDELDASICSTRARGGVRDTGCDNFPGYYSLNLEGGVSITPNADILISAQNLTDQQYRTIGSAQIEPGFDARTVIRLHF